jgi:hypothetical protein
VTVVNFMGLSLRAYVIPILPDAGIDMGVARPPPQGRPSTISPAAG